jgi:hypothetical protein
LIVENQSLVGHVDGLGHVRFRFSPKEAKPYACTIRSTAPALDGRTGSVTVFDPPADAASRPDANLPHWWTDDPSPAAAEGVHLGARTVSQWRRAFLADFAARMQRVQPAAAR